MTLKSQIEQESKETGGWEERFAIEFPPSKGMEINVFHEGTGEIKPRREYVKDFIRAERTRVAEEVVWYIEKNAPRYKEIYDSFGGNPLVVGKKLLEAARKLIV